MKNNTPEFTKKELVLIEELTNMHIDMLGCDAESDSDILTDLKEAEQLHYKLLKCLSLL
tara:strand:+ start:141 stop:317 length:177 start_codon:yes stop_codon:yes gene_type:complete